MTKHPENHGLFDPIELEAPSEIIGKVKKSGGYTKTNPRQWSEGEIDWVQQRRKDGYSNESIASALGRSQISLQIKLKRIGKKLDSYNSENRTEKYEANKEFFDLVNPKSVLDVYAGNSWWKNQGVETVTNDKDEKFQTDYNLDALDFLCKIKLLGRRFDVIDLDPYGSAYDQFDLALKLAKKGLVVSFGEWGHKRWKRLDYVKPRYGIAEIEHYGEGEAFIFEIQRLASCNKKHAEPVIKLQYANFVRVYFTLTEVKITEQWESNETL